MSIKKNKHLTLSLEQKVAIISQAENGVTQRKIADTFNIGKSTVGDIVKKKNDIMECYKEFKNNAITSRKTIKKCKHPDTEKALFLWFIQQRNNNNQIINDILLEKGKWFHTKLHGVSTNFNQTSGWLNRFKDRHGINYLKMCGERLSSDVKAVEPFKEKLKNIISDMKLNELQIYNADESALYWKKLPHRTLTGPSEKCSPGRKIPKDRITFMPCSNVNGSNKLTILVLGKAKKPRCFGKAQLPVLYSASTKGWMTRKLFENWFYEQFVPSVRKYSAENLLTPSALLIIDNAPSHYCYENNKLESDDGLIKVLYMPPNCTAIAQPMDQGVIYSTKSKYRKKFALHFLRDNNCSYENKLKKLNLKDAIFWLAESWNEISSSTIKNSWRCLMDVQETENIEPANVINLSNLWQKINPAPVQLTNDEINMWIHDPTDSATNIYTDEEILEEVLQNSTSTEIDMNDSDSDNDVDNNNEYENDPEEENDGKTVAIVETQQLNETTNQHNILYDIDNVINYCEDNLYEMQDIFLLRNIREKILIDFMNK